METVQEKIDRFSEYNRKMINVALAEHNLEFEGKPGKLILCAIFDSLSKAAFPELAKKNGKRFTQTISHHSGWSDWDRISLLQLCHAFDCIDTIPKEFIKLYDWVKAEKEKKFAPSCSILRASIDLYNDPERKDILTRWPSSDGMPKPLNGNFPVNFTHAELLWRYRNKLAHEFRLPGAGFESTSRPDRRPHYQNVGSISPDSAGGIIISHRWELIFPMRFFAQITENTLDSICQKHRENQTSPFLHFEEGSYWLS